MRGRGKRSNRNGPDSEYSIQVAICQLLDLKAPWLLYCASAGGARTSLIEARRMKAQGYKKVIARGYSACLDAIKEDFFEDNLGL